MAEPYDDASLWWQTPPTLGGHAAPPSAPAPQMTSVNVLGGLERAFGLARQYTFGFGPWQPPDEAAPQAPYRGEGSPFDQAFLAGMRFMEPYTGTAGRWYNMAVQEGHPRFTEADLSPGDADALRSVVMAISRANGGARKGWIRYPDYDTNIPGTLSLRNALGAFQYKIEDDGTVRILDNYDFNVDRGARSHQLNPLGKLFEAAAGPIGYGAAVGRSVIGSDTGRSVPVDLRIRAPVPFEDYVDSPPPAPRRNNTGPYGAGDILSLLIPLGSEITDAGGVTRR